MLINQSEPWIPEWCVLKSPFYAAQRGEIVLESLFVLTPSADVDNQTAVDHSASSQSLRRSDWVNCLQPHAHFGTEASARGAVQPAAQNRVTFTQSHMTKNKSFIHTCCEGTQRNADMMERFYFRWH